MQHHAHVYMGHDPAVCAHSLAIGVAWELGRLDEAANHAREAVAHSRNIEHIPSVVHALILVGLWHTETGDHAMAMQAAEELAALSEAHQLGAGIHAAHTFRGWARVRNGEIEAGLPELEESVEAWRQTGARLHLPHRLSLLGDAYSLARRHEQALDTFRTSLEVSATTGEVQYEPPTFIRQGEALLRQDSQNNDKAEQSFRRAREIAAEQEAIAYELRAAIALSQLLADNGRRSEAVQILHETLTRAPAKSQLRELTVAADALTAYS